MADMTEQLSAFHFVQPIEKLPMSRDRCASYTQNQILEKMRDFLCRHNPVIIFFIFDDFYVF